MHTRVAERRMGRARALREAFEELGPAFIKAGQLMSVRPDLFGPELAFEMERLQDSVAPSPTPQIRRVIERELGHTVEELFDGFDDVPIASASIAQVYRARLRRDYRPVVGEVLPAGTPVAIKVVRSGVEAAVSCDLDALRGAIRRVGGLGRLRRYGLESFAEELARSLRSECDLRNEARVADRFAFDFRHDRLMVVPRVVWPLTTRRVMTTEFVEGWRLSEMGEAERRGIDGRALAEHGAQVFLRQVLELGRFHADLHPANLFVTPDGRICYLDFGITGTTRPHERVAIAQVLAATVYGDADRALRYSAELGLVVPPERERAVRHAVAELMSRTLTGTPRDVRGFAMGFLRIMDDARVRVPPGYGLLIKALVTVEGVAKSLYPDIDIVESAGPYATRLIARRMLEPHRVAVAAPRALRAAIREFAE